MKLAISKNNMFKRKDSSMGYKPSDFMRAQIDMMMGTTDESQHLQKFTDENVCRMFLLDCCPYGRFDGCKLDVPNICTKTHSLRLRTDFEKNGADCLYEVDGYLELKEFMQDQDAKFRSREENLFNAKERKEREIVSLETELSELDARLDDLMAERNQVDANVKEITAEKLDKSIDALIKSKRRLVENIDTLKLNIRSQSDLRMCGSCGGFVSVDEGDRRFNDHIEGKQHVEFEHLRKKLEKFKQIALEKKQLWKNHQLLPTSAAKMQSLAGLPDSLDKPQRKGSPEIKGIEEALRSKGGDHHRRNKEFPRHSPNHKGDSKYHKEQCEAAREPLLDSESFSSSSSSSFLEERAAKSKNHGGRLKRISKRRRQQRSPSVDSDHSSDASYTASNSSHSSHSSRSSVENIYDRRSQDPQVSRDSGENDESQENAIKYHKMSPNHLIEERCSSETKDIEPDETIIAANRDKSPRFKIGIVSRSETELLQNITSDLTKRDAVVSPEGTKAQKRNQSLKETLRAEKAKRKEARRKIREERQIRRAQRQKTNALQTSQEHAQ
ncbi:MAG: putative RNA-binding protein Luc7-like 1 [Marteilia pararefringens]